jgi:hypothetical protein
MESSLSPKSKGEVKMRSAKCFYGWLARQARCLAIFATVVLVEQLFFAGALFASGSIYDYTYPGDWRSTRMWLPENIDTIRGILIVGNGAGGDNRSAVDQTAYQRFGELFDFAVIGTSQWGWMEPTQEMPMWDQNLAALASASGHPELVNAPWAPIGLSNGGQMSYGFNAARPDKTLAFIANKGAYYWDQLPSEAALKTPGILIAGQLDTDLRRTNIHNLFTNNRPRGALWTWVEEQSMGHAGTDDRLVLPLMAEAIRLRYPQDQKPTATSGITLRTLNESDGWLIDVSSPVSELTQMASYVNYTGDRSIAGWLPNEGMADVFRAFATYDKNVTLFPGGDVVVSDKAPLTTLVIVDTMRLPDWSKIEVFDYAGRLAAVSSGGSPSYYALFNITLADPAVHGLWALVTHADGVTLSRTTVTAFITVPEPGAAMLLGSCVAGLAVWGLARSRRRR